MNPDLRDLVEHALAEDRADDDVTTLSTVPEGAQGRARLITRQACVVAGLDVFAACFGGLDVMLCASAGGGEEMSAGATLARVRGDLRRILTVERTALNFVQRLSGIATMTREFVRRAPGVELRDTRKTTPGLRALEKAAVRAGGATNHRADLAAAILIKDNHVVAAGSIEQAIKAARAAYPGLHLEAECDTLDQVRAALDAGANELLLDNMDPATMREAVGLANGRARTEASGGVTLDTVAAIAATGVDSISAGALTHSAPAIDMSLEVEVL